MATGPLLPAREVDDAVPDSEKRMRATGVATVRRGSFPPPDYKGTRLPVRGSLSAEALCAALRVSTPVDGVQCQRLCRWT